MARKSGFGKVVLNGRVLTTNDYKMAAIRTLGELSTYVSTDTIISHASNRGWVEKNTRTRQANSHPMFRIMTTLTYQGVVKRRVNSRGILEYTLA